MRQPAWIDDPIPIDENQAIERQREESFYWRKVDQKIDELRERRLDRHENPPLHTSSFDLY
jgi:hypothetical protein